MACDMARPTAGRALLATARLEQLEMSQEARVELERSLAETGAFMLAIDSTPVAAESVARAQAAAWSFFRQPDVAKRSALDPGATGVSRGYAPAAAPHLSFGSASRPDLKETFTVGTNSYSDRAHHSTPTELAMAPPEHDYGAALPDPVPDSEYFAAEAADGRFYAANHWPAGGEAAALRPTWSALTDGLHLLAGRLAAVFELTLAAGLQVVQQGELVGPSGAGRHFSELRAVHYPDGTAGDVSSHGHTRTHTQQPYRVAVATRAML